MSPHKIISGKPDMGLSLALAVIASSNAPLLLLDGNLRIVAASASFCHAFHVDVSQVGGRSIYDLGLGEWDVPQLRSLLGATVAGVAEVSAYEMDLARGRDGIRRLVLNAQKLDYSNGAPTRLLLAVSDVTEARLSEKLKDDLLREKAVLLQEVQHRVANSLQIIASILLQSAKKVMSEEARGHLHSAHDRVLSIASVQQQLAASRLGDVELRPYLTQLCQSLGASMIRDHQQIQLKVQTDASAVKADVSVSLGLIVTELVINALKHAFPSGRKGRVEVGFQADGEDWRLCVRDDGIGMPSPPHQAKAGLGTTIVEALAKQLFANVVVAAATPGTSVAIEHTRGSLGRL